MPNLDAEPRAPTGGREPGERHPSTAIEPPCGQPRTVSEELARFESAKRECGLGFATPAAGALILANTLLGGSGMLGLPHAISTAGWLVGSVLLVLFGCFSAFGAHLLHHSARRIGTAPCSFYSVATAVAPSWTWLIDGAVMIKCFGVGTSYLIIVGDNVPDALRYFGLDGFQRWHAIICGFILGGSLACMRNLSALKYTAVVSLMVVSWTAVVIVLFFARLGDAFDPCAATAPAAVRAALAAAGPAGGVGAAAELLAAGSEALPCHHAVFRPVVEPNFLTLGKALPVFIFSFTCQQNVFSVCNEVREASGRRVDGMIAASYLFSGVAFGLTGVLAYATYGSLIESDVLEGYPQGIVVQITRLLFGLLATLSYPMQVHPSRASALALWSMMRGPTGVSANSQQEALTNPEAGSLRAERRRFAIVTAVGLALSLTVALSVKNLGTILGVVGATGSTTVSYILPGLCYFVAFPDGGFKRVMAFCQLGLGCVIMPVCLVVLFL